MTEAEVIEFINATFAGVQIVVAAGDHFFFYDPGGPLPADRRFPFATLVTSDAHDAVSALNRPGVFRLNVGVKKETFRSLFGPPPVQTGSAGDVEAEHDFAALDRLLPHPVYAAQCWVCVLSPSEATMQAVVRPLLDEAYKMAVASHEKRVARG